MFNFTTNAQAEKIIREVVRDLLREYSSNTNKEESQSNAENVEETNPIR